MSAADGPLPNCQHALDAFETERAPGKGPKITVQDRAAMDQAGADLAAATPDRGLKVGEHTPPFRLSNARGQAVAPADLLTQGPVVLTFGRGAWCPYCNLQLRFPTQSRSAMVAAGSRLVASTA